MPEQLHSARGPGRILVAVYGVLALAATGRSILQIVEYFERAPLAYLLSALAALIYVVATALLGFELRWGMGKMVGVMLAGCVPFLSFWVEHRVSAQARDELAAREVREVAAGRLAA